MLLALLCAVACVAVWYLMGLRPSPLTKLARIIMWCGYANAFVTATLWLVPIVGLIADMSCVVLWHNAGTLVSRSDDVSKKSKRTAKAKG